MTPGLNGYVANRSSLRQLVDYGWRFFRVGPDAIDYLKQAVPDSGLLVILRNADHVDNVGASLRGAQVEYWNEPDIATDGVIPPATYAAEAVRFIAAAHRVGAYPWIGSISNLNRRGFGWLRAMILALPPIDQPYGITVHRYPNGRSWRDPHDSFASREAEVAALTAIIGTTRPWAVSEFGYHTAPQRRVRWLPFWWPRNTWHWSDARVLELVSAELFFWRQAGAQFAVCYQVTDGPSEAAIDRYGVLRLDGTLKPVAAAPGPLVASVLDVGGHVIDGP